MDGPTEAVEEEVGDQQVVSEQEDGGVVEEQQQQQQDEEESKQDQTAHGRSAETPEKAMKDTDNSDSVPESSFGPNEPATGPGQVVDNTEQPPATPSPATEKTLDTVPSIVEQQEENGVTGAKSMTLEVQVPDNTSDISIASQKIASRKGWKTRKRGRQARIAAIDEAKGKKSTKGKTASTNGSHKAPTENDDSWHIHELPSNQYEIDVRRRANRKGTPGTQTRTAPKSPPRLPAGRRSIFREPTKQGVGGTTNVKSKDDDFAGYDEELGDVSLGMKLNIVGGKVIVQNVTALTDGRASPAQLTGMIQRGDVLLCIEGKSIVNLPIGQLVEGLKPLSTPDESGLYKRTLRLRFAIGEGTALLDKSEQQASKANNDAGAADMFSLTQLFHQGVPGSVAGGGTAATTTTVTGASNASVASTQVSSVVVKKTEDRTEPPTQFVTITKSTVKVSPANPSSAKAGPSSPLSRQGEADKFDKVISSSVASRRRTEHDRFNSEYFAWDESKSELLRPDILVYVGPDLDDSALRALKQMVQTGTLAMKGARLLSINVENIDKGKDLRSFQAWNANISVRSRASTRRRYFYDTASVASSKFTTANLSATSEVSDEDGEDDEGLDSDEVLVRLAAHDEIWRKQVLGDLQETIDDIAREDRGEPPRLKSKEPSPTSASAPLRPQAGPNPAMSDTIGSLFLGDRLHQKIKNKKKPHALPPTEVTSVLFDLISHLASMTPDEISLRGGFGLNAEMALVPFQHSKRTQDTEDKVLATHFILNNVYPVWLQSFKPLGWQQRKLLWNMASANSNDTIAGGTYAVSDDGLTLDSGDTKASLSTKGKKKTLQELIEEMELDAESKVETCFLVTFYFSREVLPRVRGGHGTDGTGIIYEKEQDALTFIDQFGAYLKLPISLAYASFLESDNLVKKLLDLAKSDTHHRRVMKELAKKTFLLYDQTMLSAIIARLRTIQTEKDTQEQHRILGFCVNAYPDIRPWQVRNVTFQSEKDTGRPGLYYEYLTKLLHPEEGDDRARQDAELVKEWCGLSVQFALLPNNDDNQEESRVWIDSFFQVASRRHKEYLLYKRDLVFLMDQSLLLQRRNLFLDLVDEIIDLPEFAMVAPVIESEASKEDSDVPNKYSHVVDTLRTVARKELEKQAEQGGFESYFVGYIFRLFRKISRVVSVSDDDTTPFEASKETHKLVEFLEGLPDTTEKKLASKFIAVLVNQVEPSDALDTMLLWTTQTKPPAEDIAVSLQTVLRKGADVNVQTELSSTLYQIHRARLTSDDGGVIDGIGTIKTQRDAHIEPGIWRRLCATHDGQI